MELSSSLLSVKSAGRAGLQSPQVSNADGSTVAEDFVG